MAGSTKTRKTSAKKKAVENKPNQEQEKRKKELEEKIRRRVALEEKAFRIVESFIDGSVTEQQLIEASLYIDPNHYADIVEERSISSLCGYPICDQTLTKVAQKKYHISTKTNRVYDITDRKKFCSNQCYKASVVVERQLSSTPVWLREDKWQPPVITLMDTSTDKGSAGEEVISNAATGIKEELMRLEDDVVGNAAKPKAAQKPEVGYERDRQSQEGVTLQTVADTVHSVLKLSASYEEESLINNNKDCRDNQIEDIENLTGDKSSNTLCEDSTKIGTSQVTRKEGETDNSLVTAPKPVLKKSSSSDSFKLPKPLKKRVSISEIPLPPAENSEVGVGRRRSSGAMSDVSMEVNNTQDICEEEDGGNIKSVSLTERLQGKVYERRQSLAEPATPDVFTEGEATTLQAAVAFFQKTGAIGEVTDVTSVREVILLDSDGDENPDNEEAKDSNEAEGEEKTSPVPQRRKSISEAAAVVQRLSGGSAVALNPNLPGLSGARTTGSIGSISPEKRRSISQAALSAANRRKSTGTQLKGVKSLKELLKTEIESLDRGESLFITEKLEERVTQRRKSVSEPSTPEVFNEGGPTTTQAKQVGTRKGSYVEEMHSTVAMAQHRVNQYKHMLNNDSYKTEQFGRSYPKDMTDSENSKSLLLGDILKQNGDFRSVLDAAKELRKRSSMKKQSLAETTSNSDDNDSVKSCKMDKDNSVLEANIVTPKSMSVSEVLKNAQRLSDQKAALTQGNKDNQAKSSDGKKRFRPAKISAMHLVKATLYKWKSNDTMKLLSTRDSSTLITDAEKQDFARQYAALCRKVDSLSLDIDEDIESDLDCEADEPKKGLPAIEMLKEHTDQTEPRVKEYYGMNRKSKADDANAHEPIEKSEPKEVVLPYIDSHSQMALRRKIVLDKLNKALGELLLPLQLSVTEVTPDLRQLVQTFRFTSSNINLRPAEWTLVGFLILRLLALRNKELEKGFQGPYAVHYFRAMSLSAGLTETEIQQVIDHMTGRGIAM